MKIGIDGLLLTTPFPCGTKNYAENLLNSLAKIDKKNEYIIFATKDIVIPKRKNFKFHKIESKLPIFKRQLLLPKIAQDMSVDVFHYLEPFGSVFNQHKRILTTIHDYDLEYTYPFKSSFLRRINGEILRLFTLKRSKLFITDTSAIRSEIKNHGFKQKTFVINAGVSPVFKQIKNKIKDDYFLAMADFAPRKNISRTIKAFSELNPQIRKIHRLKVVTTNKKAKSEMEELAVLLGVKQDVDFVYDVSQNDLIRLYNNALCFLYPSLYEGFGLPVIEAMACGCPVITSNIGATKEISGGAALLVEPMSVENIKSAMDLVINNPIKRSRMVAMGLARAKSFSWEQTAIKTLKVYEYLFKNY